MDLSYYEGKFKVRTGKMFVKSVVGKEWKNGQITEISKIELTSDENEAKIFSSHSGAKSVYNKFSLGTSNSAQLEKQGD